VVPQTDEGFQLYPAPAASHPATARRSLEK